MKHMKQTSPAMLIGKLSFHLWSKCAMTLINMHTLLLACVLLVSLGVVITPQVQLILSVE